jgi:DNA segregation ATPase FtsK/SpoIIIE-like protein
MDSQDQITYLGKVDHRNKLTKFGIKPKDRTKHMYIIGKTGTGKSTFLENMIVQDIQNGHGVAFIDPHGGSADKLLDYIPEWRLDDVIYFNPSDFEYPIAFNPLEDPGPEKRHLVSDGLMSVFKKIWPDAFSGRMEYILNTTMMSLLEYPDSTVLSINRMLTDKDFRKRVVASVTDSAVKNAWDELMKWDDKRWSEAVAALINKVGQFSTNPVIRNILGQSKSTFDFRKAMDERKIIIINLSKGMIGEQNAPLLGAMLITKIYLAAMSRAELPAHVIEKMPPFYFYVDEFQNFANESFASILSEARKYKLCLTVANQFIAQMEETIRDAVFGNMGTTVAFRVGTLDAEFMEKVFAPVFTQEDLQNIAFAQMYLTLQIDNMGSKPFSAKALDPIPPLQSSMREQVIERSRKNFARPRLEVEESVKEFFGYAKTSGAKVISSETVHTPAKETFGTRPRTVPVAPTPSPVQAFTSKPVPPRQPAMKSPLSRPLRPSATSPYKGEDTPSRPLAPKPVVQKTSASLNDLLSKLDNVVATPPVVQPQEIVAPVVSTPVSKPTEVPKPFVRDDKKELTRAASPEKKSALQEALAKAMAGKSAATTESTPEPKTPQSGSMPSPEVPPQLQQTPLPTYTQSKTIREVPEDILRKALE